MIGRTNSGGSRIFSMIAVTYPEGSLCSCTKGTRTLKAKDRSGKALFNVPEAGDWLIECQTEDGSKKKSRSVKIGGAGEGVAVKLSYELELFDNGELFEDATGGWIKNGKAVPEGEAPVTMSGSYHVGASIHHYLRCKNKIMITDYSTLHFKGRLSGDTIHLMVSDNEYLSGSCLAEVSVQNKTEVDLDISKCKGEHFIGICYGKSSGADPGSWSVSMDRMWLE